MITVWIVSINSVGINIREYPTQIDFKQAVKPGILILKLEVK